MKILFLTRRVWPEVGGVEKHVQEISLSLRKKGHRTTTISEKDIKYPRIKFLGLLYIWFWLFKNRKLIEGADIVHCHDVFIWYLPFRFLYPKKPVFTTFHGWEGIYPIPLRNILIKKLSNKLSLGSIAVGLYIEKYYGIKANKVLYGGTILIHINIVKREKNLIVFVGRLEKDTGVLEFLRWIGKNIKQKNRYVNLLHIGFVGDGSLREECEKFGKVHGFCDPKPFLKKADICVPAGYLSYIEAKSFGCKIMVFPNNPLKRDYWKEIEKVKKFPTWSQIADEYLSLYNYTK